MVDYHLFRCGSNAARLPTAKNPESPLPLYLPECELIAANAIVGMMLVMNAFISSLHANNQAADFGGQWPKLTSHLRHDGKQWNTGNVED